MSWRTLTTVWSRTSSARRIDFASWTERMAPPPLHVQAIRSLQTGMPAEVTRHFAVEPDGSFMLDTMTIAAVPLP